MNIRLAIHARSRGYHNELLNVAMWIGLFWFTPVARLKLKNYRIIH